jgi:hypothetical protein
LWFRFVTPALERPRQEDNEFKTSLGLLDKTMSQKKKKRKEKKEKKKRQNGRDRGEITERLSELKVSFTYFHNNVDFKRPETICSLILSPGLT